MKTLYVTKRSAWRSWLQENAGTAQEIWLVYYKKSSAKPRIPYQDAIEEALCFGWIDGLIKRIDGERFGQRFTPRKPGSRWSELNIARVRKLMRQRRMTPAGMAVFHAKKRTVPHPTDLPQELERKFRGQQGAWKNFLLFPPYYRKMTIGWVASAKKEPTQLKRLQQLIDSSANNKQIKFM